MSTTDLSLFAAYLVSAWAAGFTGGYIITKFKHAMNQI